MSSRPPCYIPADQLVVGDQIVLDNKVWEIGRIEVTNYWPTLFLWPVGEVHGEPHKQHYPAVPYAEVRVFKIAGEWPVTRRS